MLKATSSCLIPSCASCNICQGHRRQDRALSQLQAPASLPPRACTPQHGPQYLGSWAPSVEQRDLVCSSFSPSFSERQPQQPELNKMDTTGADACIALRRTPRTCTLPSQHNTRAVSKTRTADSATAAAIGSSKQQQTVIITKTPSKPRSRKRVRFSDPGSQGGLDSNDNDQFELDQRPEAALSSTGLTPMIRHSSLGTSIATSTASPSAKRRRHSFTPTKSTSALSAADHDGNGGIATRQEGVRFPSLRQILSDRVKRRIRRNGLSEEMNAIAAEQRQLEQLGDKDAELQQLRESLAAKDEEIERLREMSMLDTTSTVLDDSADTSLPAFQRGDVQGDDVDSRSSKLVELEREVETLRRNLTTRSSPPCSSSSVARQADETGFYDWTSSARDPYSDYTDMDMDIEESRFEDSAFGDSTMVDLVCSTPSRRQKNKTVATAGTNISLPTGSFPTPPCTSPTIPATPSTAHRGKALHVLTTPSSHVSASVQVSLPDVDAEAMKAELESLRLELSKITETLEFKAALQTRLSDKVSSGLSAFGPSTSEASVCSQQQASDVGQSANVETQLAKLLQVLSDRTAALHELNSSLASLGFPGSDSSEIITSLTSSLRAARLELEYLTPGELAIPLTSHGAEVLDLVLTRLRDLARKEHEHEQTIDEYHALELSLRQQLKARVEIMDALRAELKSNEQSMGERDEKISDLEIGINRLKGAAEGYRRDIVELEGLVQRMDHDMVAAADAAEAALSLKEKNVDELRAAAVVQESELRNELNIKQDELAECNSALLELSQKLSTVIEQTDHFDSELSAMHESKQKEIKSLNRNHGKALAIRDARVTELRSEIDAINASLRRAYSTIQKLRVENVSLGQEVEAEKTRAKQAVDEMKAEMQRVVEMSNGFLATPKRGSSSGVASKRKTVTSTPTRRKSARTSSLAANSALTEGTTLPTLTKPAKRPRRYDSGIGLDDEVEGAGELE
ncbi:nuclear mitotic apparatus protein 1 [Microdochium nivale]|nr:nuclear mitotic apparatus protein 1 [Microdochium nivale]